MSGGASPTSQTKNPFLAFLTDPASMQAIKGVAEKSGWTGDLVQEGTIEQASQYLKEHKTPEFLLVEVPSAEAAPGLLDALAEICDPGVKLIVTGKINEFSFYTWLMELGAYDYLLEPITEQALITSLRKKTAQEKATISEKKQGKVIACIGTRGGVGASTVTCNLAWLMGQQYGLKCALIDADPQFGSIAMMFDVDPTRELMTLLQSPERIDGLFLDRAMSRINDKLDILSAEEPLKEQPNLKAQAADVLLKLTREKYDLVLIDLPRTLDPLSRGILTQADQVVVVTEVTLQSLRDALRLQDVIKELRRAFPVVVANRIGMHPKSEISKSEFDKNYGKPLEAHIPYTPEAASALANGQVLLSNCKQQAVQSAFHTLAKAVCGELLPEAQDSRKSGLLQKLRKGNP